MASEVSLEVEACGIDDLGRNWRCSRKPREGKHCTNVRSCTQIERSKTRYSRIENGNEGGRKMRQ